MRYLFDTFPNLITKKSLLNVFFFIFKIKYLNFFFFNHLRADATNLWTLSYKLLLIFFQIKNYKNSFFYFNNYPRSIVFLKIFRKKIKYFRVNFKFFFYIHKKKLYYNFFFLFKIQKIFWLQNIIQQNQKLPCMSISNLEQVNIFFFNYSKIFENEQSINIKNILDQKLMKNNQKTVLFFFKFFLNFLIIFKYWTNWIINFINLILQCFFYYKKWTLVNFFFQNKFNTSFSKKYIFTLNTQHFQFIRNSLNSRQSLLILHSYFI